MWRRRSNNSCWNSELARLTGDNDIFSSKLILFTKLKPVTVLEAFQAAALSVDRDINAVCDFILEARDWALQLEAVPENERGALYGLPFSVKVVPVVSPVV